mgnify:CR=1 FL=1
MSIFLKTDTVKKEWTDYNGHMNLAYYIHIFDNAAEILLQKFKMGADSAKNDKKSTFAVETYTTYNHELKDGEEVNINVLYLDYDKKRIQYKLSMIHKEKKYLAATTEVLSLYIDLNKRKVAEFESEKIVIMDDFIKSNSSKFNTEKLVLLNKLKK